MGEVFERTLFIPPAIVVPQQFCESCWFKTRQKERETLPYVIIVLAFVMFIPLAFILFKFIL
jgi:hypothetical protein